MPEDTQENIEKLALSVLDSWDLGTVMEYAYEGLIDTYHKDTETFNLDWENMFGEEK